VPLANLFTQFFVELHTDFFHDFQVRAFGHFGNNLTPVLVVKVGFRFPSGLLKFVLSNLLIKDLFKEFVQVFLSHLVVQLTTMGLNNVAATR
jgi:hypothetical protein